MDAREPAGGAISEATSSAATGLVIFATSRAPSASPVVPSSPSSLSASLVTTGIRVNLNFCSEADVNETVTLIKPKIDMSVYYVYVCPVVISVCFFSIIFNATLMSISRQSKLINKSPILLLSLNLAVTDLIASTLNGLNILLISYLPMVHKIPINTCTVLILELLRYSATLASALHLLALAFVHYRGTVNPLQYRSRIFYSQHLSRTINIISICCWLLPLTLMIVWFNSTPCQGFKPAKCDYLFLLGFAFRYMILIVFSVPLLLMSIIYVRIFLFISRHQKGFVFAASSTSKTDNNKPAVTSNETSGGVNAAATAANLEVAAGVEQSRGNSERFCPVCSLAEANEEANDDADELVEVESVTILSGQSSESPPGSEDELDTGSSTQLQPAAAVSLVHNDQDDSYTIKSKLAEDSGGGAACEHVGGKSKCNDPTGNVTQIDNDPVARECHGRVRVAASPDDAQEVAGSGLMPAKLNCERQPLPSVAARGQARGEEEGAELPSSAPLGPQEAADRPLADPATARTQQLSDEGRSSPALGPAKSQGSTSLARLPQQRQRRPLGQSGSNNEDDEDATARPPLLSAGADKSGMPLRQHVSSAEAGHSLCESDRTSDRVAESAAELKREQSNPIASVKSTHNSYTSSASRWRPPRVHAGGHRDRGNGTSNSNNSNIKNRPDPSSDATPLRCTCDNKLNQSTIKPLCRSNTLATTGETVDVATRRRTTTVAWKSRAPGRTSALKTTATNIKTATTSRTNKLNLEPSISSRLSAYASAAATATTAGAVPNSSLRSGAGSGDGCDSELDSGTSSSSVSGSCSSGTDGKGCAVGPNGRPAHGSTSQLATGPSCLRARLLELKSKSNSLRAHSEAASLTVTTLTSGHPAHTNFSSASSSLNHHHHHHRNCRHQSNSVSSNHHHKHHHHHHNPHEPQRLNSKKNAVPPTNTKALVTTLLILGTYIISYLPAILFSALTCIDSVYCPYPLYTVPERVRLVFGTMTMLLLIAKSIVDPLIYSYRMNEIQQAISRYMSKRRSGGSSRATSLYTNSQRFAANRGQATQLTNFATSSFKLLTSTQTSLRGPSSRATSIRINQHQFDRPASSIQQQQQQQEVVCNAGERNRIDEVEEEHKCGGEPAAPSVEPPKANSVHDMDATGMTRISETIVSFSGDTGRSIVNDKLERVGALNISRSIRPIGCDRREKLTLTKPKAADMTAAIATSASDADLVC